MRPHDPEASEPILRTRTASEPDEAEREEPEDGRFAARYASARQRSRSRSRLVRVLAVLFPILLVLALGLFLGGRLWLRHALEASLPQVDGSLAVPGLSAPVTVRRDARGVPHLHAASLDDLVLAQGYVTAQDRLWQMDALRRNASGDLAAVLGAALVAHDRAQRLLQVRTSAERAAAALPPAQRHMLEQYARGVNASMAAQSAHLPLEFQVLRYTPAPWTPRDSMLVALSMFQDLSTSFPQELGREAVMARLPPALAADLYPVGSWRDHPPGQTVDLSAPAPSAPASQSRLDPALAAPAHVAGLLAAIPSLPGATSCDACRAGSNDWVVAGDHSTTGKPLLANDTHLGHTVPGIWYESDLEAPNPDGSAFHVAGVAIPGTPFIVIGHNAHVAWGFTNLGGDVQDVYLEHLRRQGDVVEYQSADTAWHPVEHRPEIIHVRNGADVRLDVLMTHHGSMETPIITGLFPSEKRPLSLRWTIYDPTVPNSPFYDIDAAADWPSFSAALARYGGPTQNLVYGDDQGHIAYHVVGQVPFRGTDPAHPQPLAPVPTDSTAADAASHEWSSYIPFDALPSVVDPPNGLLATANARVAPDGYALPLTLNWAEPYRNERIWKLLAGKPRLAPEDMLAIQTDVYSDLDHVIAQRLAYALDHATEHPGAGGKPRLSFERKRLHQAADLLRVWNGQVDAGATAPAIVDATRAALWPMLLGPRLGEAAALYQWGESGYAEEQIIMHTPQRWLPPGFANWDDLLVAAVERGLTQARAPLDVAKWTSGQTHPMDVEHPIYGQSKILGLLIGLPIGTGVQPQSGDTSTVKQVGRTFGPSERLTVSLADPDRTTLNLVLGQSGNPASPHFLDQFQAWLHGTTFPMPFTDAATVPATRHILTLHPE